MNTNESSTASQSKNTLKVALGLIGAICLLNLGLSLAILLWILPLGRSADAWTNSRQAVRELRSRPIKEQLDTASVIALTKWAKTGDQQKGILAEILKQDPSVSFPFKVGDEIREAQRPTRDGVDYGEGELMFFTGSPPKLEYSAAYSEGRVRNAEETRLDTIRDLLRK